jgi:hypothetical protein
MKTPTTASTARTGAPSMSRALAGAAICGRSPWYGIENVGTSPVTVFADHKLRARRLEESLQ